MKPVDECSLGETVESEFPIGVDGGQGVIGIACHLTDPMNRTVVVGSPKRFEYCVTPDSMIRPFDLYSNVPCADFLLIRKFTVALFGQIRTREADAWEFSTLNSDVWTPAKRLLADVCRPNDSMVILCDYTGFVPPTMKAGDEFKIDLYVVGVGNDQDRWKDPWRDLGSPDA